MSFLEGVSRGEHQGIICETAEDVHRIIRELCAYKLNNQSVYHSAFCREVISPIAELSSQSAYTTKLITGWPLTPANIQALVVLLPSNFRASFVVFIFNRHKKDVPGHKIEEELSQTLNLDRGIKGLTLAIPFFQTETTMELPLADIQPMCQCIRAILGENKHKSAHIAERYAKRLAHCSQQFIQGKSFPLIKSHSSVALLLSIQIEAAPSQDLTSLIEDIEYTKNSIILHRAPSIRELPIPILLCFSFYGDIFLPQIGGYLPLVERDKMNDLQKLLHAVCARILRVNSF